MSYGVEWKGGDAEIHVSGGSGRGVITGLSPHTVMRLSVMLAMAARSRHVEWPRPLPWDEGVIAELERESVTGLEVQAGERTEPDRPVQPSIDVRAARIDLETAISKMRRAIDCVEDAIGYLDEDEGL